MDLWLRLHLLLVGLLACSAASTPDKCAPLMSPVSLDGGSVMFGSWNTLVGYADGELFKKILKLTDSSVVNISKGSDGGVQLFEKNKINGTCISSFANGTMDGDMVTVSMMNVTSVFHVLPSGGDYLVLSANSTTGDMEQLLSAFKINMSGSHEASIRSLYLMGRGSTVKDSDLEQFKHQAQCLGFHTEPDFHQDPETELCTDAESVPISF